MPQSYGPPINQRPLFKQSISILFLRLNYPSIVQECDASKAQYLLLAGYTPLH